MCIGNFMVFISAMSQTFRRRGKKLIYLCEISGFCHGVVGGSLLFWDVTQRWLVVSDRFGTACQSLFTGPKQSKKRNFNCWYVFCISFPLILIFRKTFSKYLFIHNYLCEKDKVYQPWKFLVLQYHRCSMIWYCLSKFLVLQYHRCSMIWYCLSKFLQTWTSCSQNEDGKRIVHSP